MIDLAIRALLVGLAGWRVAALISYEDGPLRVFARLRAIVAPPAIDGEIVRSGRLVGLRLEIEKALSCVWCLSPYTAGAGWLAWEASPAVVAVVAAATIVVAVERWNHG